jgi:hypothetical protein
MDYCQLQSAQLRELRSVRISACGSSLLFEVSSYDPVLSAGAVGLLLAVGTTACLLPARRSSGADAGPANGISNRSTDLAATSFT